MVIEDLTNLIISRIRTSSELLTFFNVRNMTSVETESRMTSVENSLLVTVEGIKDVIPNDTTGIYSIVDFRIYYRLHKSISYIRVTEILKARLYQPGSQIVGTDRVVNNVSWDLMKPTRTNDGMTNMVLSLSVPTIDYNPETGGG